MSIILGNMFTLPIFALALLVVYASGYLVFIIYITVFCIKEQKARVPLTRNCMPQLMYGIIAVLIWPLVLFLLIILMLVLVISVAIDAVTPSCCRDEEEDIESDSDDEYISDDESQLSDVTSLGSDFSGRSGAWKRVQPLKETYSQKRHLPKFVRRLYLKYWTDNDREQDCSVCFEPLLHRTGDIVTDAERRKASQEARRAANCPSISGLIDERIKEEEDTNIVLSMKEDEDNCYDKNTLDYDALSQYSSK